MSKSYITLMFIVICAPILFFVYLQNGLVCAPRAMAASSIFGAVPLALVTIAVLKNDRRFHCMALIVLAVELIITPIIMLQRLGWDKFITDRLTAFLTFEAIAVIEGLLVIGLMLGMPKREKDGTSKSEQVVS